MDLRIGMSGSGDQATAFKGSLKHITFFQEQFLDERKIKNAAFQYLYPASNTNMLLEVLLTDNDPVSGLVEQVNHFTFDVFGNETSKGQALFQYLDESPNWTCFYQDERDVNSLQRFQGINTNLNYITLNSQSYKDSSDSSGSYRTKMKMWIYRSSLDSTRGEARLLPNGTLYRKDQNQNDPNYFNEIVFEHKGIVKMQFEKESSDFLSITNFEDNSDNRKIKVEIPRGQWIWINCAHTQDYFAVYVKDYFGKVLHASSRQVRHAKTPNYKTSNQVRIANNFYGYIKGIKYYKDDAGISDNIDYFADSSDSNSNILLYFRFED